MNNKERVLPLDDLPTPFAEEARGVVAIGLTAQELADYKKSLSPKPKKVPHKGG